MPRNLLYAILFTSCLALLLSVVPMQALNRETRNVPTFQSMTAIELREHNLVDLFTTMSTHYNIKRVKWENRALYVDMAVASANRLNTDLLYRDFYTLVYGSFTSTSNVEHLYFRMLAQPDSNPPKLLAALQAERKKGQQLPNPKHIKDIRSFVENTFLMNEQPN